MPVYYDDISEGYDGLYSGEQAPKMKILANELSLSNSDMLLDVGCGTGLSFRFFNCICYGIDPSQKLLNKNLNKKARLVRAYAEDIPFPDDFFDCIIAVTSIHNFNNIKKGLSEIKRVGKKKFGFSVLKKSIKFEIIEKIISTEFNVKKTIENRFDRIFVVLN
ncbi:methyltransferase domain-containing protein [Candidatus Woesearchaeota archaeon]|nr:methyltransferase domain-containing protein [Candidatus Woesearchaeota archaeon]